MEEVVNGIWRLAGDPARGRQGANVYLIKEARCWLVAGIENAPDAERLLKKLERRGQNLAGQPLLIVPGHLRVSLVEELAALAVFQDGLVILPAVFFHPEVTGKRVRLPFVKKLRWFFSGGDRGAAADAVADAFIFRVRQGQRLPFSGGWQVTFTTGYGRERVFLYHPDRRILVSGKAIVNEGGETVLTLEGDAAKEVSSLLWKLKVETILPAEGGVINGRHALRDLLAAYGPAEI